MQVKQVHYNTKPFFKIEQTFYEVNSFEIFDFLIEAVNFHKIDVQSHTLSGANSYKECAVNATTKSLFLNTKTNEITTEDAKFVILHELAHIKQYQEHRLVFEFGKTYFDNKLVIQRGFTNDDHSDLPHEMDANVFAVTSPLCPANLSHEMLVMYQRKALKHIDITGRFPNLIKAGIQ